MAENKSSLETGDGEAVSQPAAEHDGAEATALPGGEAAPHADAETAARGDDGHDHDRDAGEGDDNDAEPDAGGDEDVEYIEETVVVIRRPAFIALAVAAVALIVALGAANVYQWRTGDPAVATVDGSRITRTDYEKAVARGDGGDILDNLITKILIERDAKKKGVVVTTDEVDARLKAAKAQVGTDADWQQALDSQHATELQVRDTFRLNLMVQKLVFDKLLVSDAEIQQSYDQNKDSQYQGKTLDQVKDQIKTQLQNDRQQQALGDYLSGLRSAAHISKRLPGA